MFTVDADAWQYATATAEFSVPGYSRTQIETDALELAAGFLDCGRDEIVLTKAPVFHVSRAEGEYPFRPAEWTGVFHVAHVSVEQRNMVLSRQDDDDDD